nr:DeoR/GlpR family DNA-binding transcription regulator [Ruania zhangjianzhongii]
MLVTDRRRRVLDEVRRYGSVSVRDLAERLEVSAMTIRRDLERLEAGGTLRRVRGGATMPRASDTEELAFAETSNRRITQKEAIARSAAELVHPGMCVGLSGGSTTWTLARELRHVPDLTIVTNSLRIGDEFTVGDARRTVILTGGIRTPSDALVGPVAVRALEQLHCDLVFMGVHGMDLGAGFTTPNLMEAETNRALVRSTRRLVVVADHSKWGKIGLSTIAELAAAHVLVTDDHLPTGARDDLASRIGQVLVAPTEGTRGPGPTHQPD